jgi:hypothetical protein
MAVADSIIKVNNSEEIDSLLKEKLTSGFSYKDIDLPEDWKNNETTIVLCATDFQGIIDILNEVKTEISATDLLYIHNPEGANFFIRFKI